MYRIKISIFVFRELGDHGERSTCIDNHIGAVVVMVTHAVGIVCATWFVADPFTTTLVTFAFVQACDVASMRGEVGGSRISFPYVELVAARSVAVNVPLGND